MNITETKLKGAFIFDPVVHGDERERRDEMTLSVDTSGQGLTKLR